MVSRRRTRMSLWCGVVNDDDYIGIGIGVEGDGTWWWGRGWRDTNSGTVYYRCGLIPENLSGEQNEIRQSSRTVPRHSYIYMYIYEQFSPGSLHAIHTIIITYCSNNNNNNNNSTHGMRSCTRCNDNNSNNNCNMHMSKQT